MVLMVVCLSRFDTEKKLMFFLVILETALDLVKRVYLDKMLIKAQVLLNKHAWQNAFIFSSVTVIHTPLQLNGPQLSFILN